jgi:hypothetical protein
MATPDPVLLQQLAQAHGFRLEALGDNRAGRLSAAQAKDLGWPSKAGGQVAVVESFLRVRWFSPQDLFHPTGYYYETDAELSFRVPERGTRLIDPGQRYRLYYTVKGRQLINLEPMGSTFSVVPPEGVSVLAPPFSGSPYHLSAAEVSAILGVPVTPEELNARPDPSVPGMTMVSFANLAAGVRATYGFRLGGRALKHSRLWEALIQRTGERLPALGDEAYLVANGMCYVYCGDVLLMAAVRLFQPGQVVLDRKLTLALAQALVQKLGR